MEKIFEEIREERQRQDAEWGGAEHDDTHTAEDWADCIDYQLGNPAFCYGVTKLFIHELTNEKAIRERFIKIAALAVAALESLDRKKKTAA